MVHAAPAPGPEPKAKADPAFLAAPLVYSAAAVPVAHSYSSVSQFTSHPVHTAYHAAVPVAKAAPLIASPYVAAPSAPAAVYSYPAYPAYHPSPAVGE